MSEFESFLVGLITGVISGSGLTLFLLYMAGMIVASQ